jgi:hypothetical protein
MVFFHIAEWWIQPQGSWLIIGMHVVVADIAAAGFLFISGVTTMISYRRNLIKAEISDDFNQRKVKNEYIYRGLLILIVAIIYNSIDALMNLNPLRIWTWYIPMTIAFSILLVYPLLKVSKRLRILFAILLWILNFLILSFLLPFERQRNAFSVLFYFLYNDIEVHPILFYLSYFLIGTVIGETIYEIYLNDDRKTRLAELKFKLILPLLITGGTLTGTGVLLFSPDFLLHGTISAIIYSLGVILILTAIILFIDEFEVFKAKKSHKFFYYYSYYSLTIYLTHNSLYFLFTEQLNLFNIWIFLTALIVLLTLLIRFARKKYGIKVSVKVQLSRLARGITNKIEKHKNEQKIFEHEELTKF